MSNLINLTHNIDNEANDLTHNSISHYDTWIHISLLMEHQKLIEN